jgi:hypothetical protein
MCGSLGLPCSPAFVERPRLCDGCGCRCAWWRYNSGYGDGHVPLTPKGFGEGWATMAEGSEKQEPYSIRSTPSRSTSAKRCPCTRVQGLICREQPIGLTTRTRSSGLCRAIDCVQRPAQGRTTVGALAAPGARSNRVRGIPVTQQFVAMMLGASRPT